MKPLSWIVLLFSIEATCFAQAPDPDAQASKFTLSSSAIGKDNVLPPEFTGDGAGISPPLKWTKGPAGTKSYAVIMHHIDREGLVKWYWTLWDIPPSVTELPKNSKKIGTLGTNEMNRDLAYAPPHSKGPGTRTYVITVYALLAVPKLDVPAWRVNRAVLLTAMKGLILDQAELKVTHTSKGNP